MRFLVLLALVGLSVNSVYADTVLRAGDVLALKMTGVPTDDIALISVKYTVDEEGYLHLSYIGNVMVQGLTLNEAQTKIERAYVNQGIFSHPTITLNTLDAIQFVIVGSEGDTPMCIPYTPDMTVLSTVGAREDSWLNPPRVRLIRSDSVKIINIRKTRANPLLDEKVYPGDTIQVPTSIW